eukprot:m.12052 g.12052  ORF g.12052 m.12052 type:complete len:603 (-) comp4168_c0_seq2:214-2022(-)
MSLSTCCDCATALLGLVCDNFLLVVALAVAGMLWHYREAILGGWRKRIVVPIPPEADPGWADGPVLAERSIKDPSNPRLVVCFDPCSGRKLGTMPAMTPEQVRQAVAAAREAQNKWATSSWDTRRQLLKLLQDYIVENQETICQVAARDTGKTMVDGAFGEVLTTCEKIRWTLAHGERVLKPEHRDVGWIMTHKNAGVYYEPLGVLGAIIPWNYPFHNMYGQLISTLFAGNGIVLKVSEHASWSAQYYVSIVHAALERLGYSKDLVQIVTGFGDAGNALVCSGVDKVVFIGSPEVGKLVMRAASETLTPVVLELGGKDCAIVCDDCDFDQVVQLSLRGTFQNCGQNCIGLERLIVHAAIYDRFVETMAANVSALSQGAPLDGDVDCGAMTMGSLAMKGIQDLVDDAVSKGARLLAGGKPNTAAGPAFYTPTLLVDVTSSMRIAQQEVFGPVMVIMKAADDKDALGIANGCEYGLGSSVFSLDTKRATRIANALNTGMCNVNDFGVNYLCQSLPFGGVKISGFDRFAGVEGLRGCCVPRAMTSDKLSFIRTTIPPPLQYPVTSAGFKFCKGLIQMFYGDGMGARIAGIAGLISASLATKPKQS